MRNREPGANYTRIPRVVALSLGLAVVAPAHAQDVAGTVYEVSGNTRAPSAGAFVIVHWTGQRPGLFHYESVCIQAAITRTDAQGRFAIAEPPPLRSTFLVWRRDPAVALYKPGFEQRDGLTLVPTPRVFHDSMAHMGCSDKQGSLIPLTDPQGVLPAFRAALASETPPKPSLEPKVQVLRRAQPQPAAPEGKIPTDAR
jgi:hypothetical protein